MVQHWIIIYKNNNFENSSKYNIWGIKSTTNAGKCFIKNVEKNDIIWFICEGKIIGMVEFINLNKRIIGSLINISLTNEELNWKGDDNWDIEIHYTNLYNLIDCNIDCKLKGQSSIRRYNKDKCPIDLEEEYEKIKRLL
jgi:hypothetical protein